MRIRTRRQYKRWLRLYYSLLNLGGHIIISAQKLFRAPLAEYEKANLTITAPEIERLITENMELQVAIDELEENLWGAKEELKNITNERH